MFSSTTQETLNHSIMGRHSVLLVQFIYAIWSFCWFDAKPVLVRLSTIVNKRPQKINSTVVRSNFDVCRWKNCDSSSSVDLKTIYCRCKMRTGLTRLAIKSCMMLLLTCFATVMLKDIAGCCGWQKQLKHTLLLVTEIFLSDVVIDLYFAHCHFWISLFAGLNLALW